MFKEFSKNIDEWAYIFTGTEMPLPKFSRTADQGEFSRMVSWITPDYSGFDIGKGIDLGFDLFIPKGYSWTMRLMYVLHNYWKFDNNFIVYCCALSRKFINFMQVCGLLLEIITTCITHTMHMGKIYESNYSLKNHY